MLFYLRSEVILHLNWQEVGGIHDCCCFVKVTTDFVVSRTTTSHVNSYFIRGAMSGDELSESWINLGNFQENLESRQTCKGVAYVGTEVCPPSTST
jgi:hypothetical protein